MILVDTSIWVDHLRTGDQALVEHLEAARVLTHPFVIGELALGDLQPREATLVALRKLPWAKVAWDEEVFSFITRHTLFRSGIGYVDAHLLAAVRLTDGARLWTRDKRLSGAATRLGLAHSPLH